MSKNPDDEKEKLLAELESYLDRMSYEEKARLFKRMIQIHAAGEKWRRERDETKSKRPIKGWPKGLM